LWTGVEQELDLTQEVLELDPEALPKPPFKLNESAVPCEFSDQSILQREFQSFAGQTLVQTEPERWQFFSVDLNLSLYTPILQLSENERILPERFEIWAAPDIGQDHSTNLSKARKTYLLEKYLRSNTRQSSEPHVYYHVVNDPKRNPGTWLIQYWFYYPFDSGGGTDHLHDSEHMFVEVDKLGGVVRRIVGAGHGRWAPNNEFHTYLEHPVSVRLPLFAVVEQGKHATAPDIDRDGLFTPGIDVNYYRDAAKVWGIRDTAATTDSTLRSFSATMMVKRKLEYALAPKGSIDIWNRGAVGEASDQRSFGGFRGFYSIEKVDPPSIKIRSCVAATVECARAQVFGHQDFRDITQILKPSIYPRFAIRFPWSNITGLPTANEPIPDRAIRPERSLRTVGGITAEVAAIPLWPGLRIRMPGRIAVDALFEKDVRSLDGVATRYEWLVTNLFGLYGGLSKITDDVGDLPLGQIGDPSPDAWVTGGGLVEIPLTRRLVAQGQGGLLFNNRFGLNWEWRTGVALAYGNPFREFGVQAQKPLAPDPQTDRERLEQLFADVNAILQTLEAASSVSADNKLKLQQVRAELRSNRVGSLWAATLLLDSIAADRSLSQADADLFRKAANTVAFAHARASVDHPNDTTETNRAPIIPFLEGTDVFWTVQRRRAGGDTRFPNKLEGDIFPHLVVAQNFASVIDVDEQLSRGARNATKEFAYSISGTPGVRIRMLRETSAPVRTPSYMPRGNFQLLWARGIKEALEQPDRRLFTALAGLPRVGLWEAHFVIGHHSNGQDGCITVGQARVPPRTGPCQPEVVVPTAENINRIDGSFSTNYMRAGINYSRNWMTLTRELQAVRELRVKGEFEYHPRKWVDDDIVELYGRARVNYQAAYAARGIRGCPKRLEGSVSGVWNPGVVETVTSWSHAFQVSCFPAVKGGWGYFARLYRGQDYYNIGFLDEITRLHVGATFNQSDFFRFRRRPAAAR
jgi:hypothetical protein